MSVILYPFLKKYPKKENTKEDKEIQMSSSVDHEDIEKISYHFTDQLTNQFINLGFNNTQKFQEDMLVLKQFMDSILYRNLDQYHEFQDVIDDYYNNEMDAEVE